MTSLAKVLKISALVASLAALPALADDAGATYTHEVLTRVAHHAVYPRLAVANSEEGVVTVAVALDTRGNLTDVNVLKSSGIPAIDLAAIQAAKDAAPYPAPNAANTVIKGKIRFAL